MRNVKAFAPANISLLFKIYDHENPRWRGSYGVGFTLSEGVTVTAEQAKEQNLIVFNNQEISLEPVDIVIKKLTTTPLKISIISDLPLGSGFGISGATTLATAYAVNELLHFGKTKKQLAILAHTAEVESGTGLGDVVNQYLGGMLAKFVPSSQFLAERLPLENIPIYFSTFSKLPTKSVITDEKKREQINTAAEKGLLEIKKLLKKKDVSFAEILTISKTFAQESGLLRDEKVKKTIASIEKAGGHATMIMLGNAVVSDINFPGAKKGFISKIAAKLFM